MSLCHCGRWAEVSETGQTRRKGLPWNRRTEREWRWVLKRPDHLMPFGWSASGSGAAWSEADAIAAATAKHEWWHEWDDRKAATRRLDFGMDTRA